MTNKEDSVLPEIVVQISPDWIRLIKWVQTSLPHGQLCVKIANANPIELVDQYTKRRLRFDKEETLPEYDPTSPFGKKA